jgi:hypothetical protein
LIAPTIIEPWIMQ